MQDFEESLSRILIKLVIASFQGNTPFPEWR